MNLVMTVNENDDDMVFFPFDCTKLRHEDGTHFSIEELKQYATNQQINEQMSTDNVKVLNCTFEEFLKTHNQITLEDLVKKIGI